MGRDLDRCPLSPPPPAFLGLGWTAGLEAGQLFIICDRQSHAWAAPLTGLACPGLPVSLPTLGQPLWSAAGGPAKGLYLRGQNASPAQPTVHASWWKWEPTAQGQARGVAQPGAVRSPVPWGLGRNRWWEMRSPRTARPHLLFIQWTLLGASRPLGGGLALSIPPASAFTLQVTSRLGPFAHASSPPLRALPTSPGGRPAPLQSCLCASPPLLSPTVWGLRSLPSLADGVRPRSAG